MSNRSESNKPLPRKQRVVNRGYLYSRKDENVKNTEITLMDMDSAIQFYFDQVIKPSVEDNGENIKVYTPTALAGGTTVTCEVVSKPAAVAWGYVVVNEQALYNSNTSVNFTLHDSEEDSLVFQILELAGVIINKVGLINIATTKQQAEQLTQNK